jgi:hypothetical protein
MLEPNQKMPEKVELQERFALFTDGSKISIYSKN